MWVPLPVGACLIIVGWGAYRGKAKAMHQVPGLTEAQQGLALMVFGAIFVIWGVVSLI